MSLFACQSFFTLTYSGAAPLVCTEQVLTIDPHAGTIPVAPVAPEQTSGAPAPCSRRAKWAWFHIGVVFRVC